MKHWVLLVYLCMLVACGRAEAVQVLSSAGTYGPDVSITAANTDPLAVGKTIRVTKPFVMSANLTLRNDVHWVFEDGAIITTTGYTFNGNNAPITIGAYQVFTGSGAVTGLKEYRPEWFGGKADSSTDNTAAFAGLARSVNAQGGNCKIIYSPGTYNFSPQNTYSSNYGWRYAVEMVDVSNVTIEGNGATLQSRVPSTWKIGNITINHGNEEGPIQFRTASLGSDGFPKCRNITVRNIVVNGVRLTGGYVADGNSYGIVFKAVYKGLIENVTASNWSTDGIYLGASYNDTYNGSDNVVKNSVMDLNMRQGCSVVGNNRVKFIGNTVSNTSGSSFGNGLDLEPDTATIQHDITVVGNIFKDNQRGSINIIRTSDVAVIGNVMNEQYTGTTPGAGVVWVDGGINGNPMSRIIISDNTITGNRSIFYVTGTAIDGLDFTGNNCLMTNNIVGSNLMVRLAPSAGNTNTNFRINKNRFEGCGGFLLAVAGDVWFEDNLVLVSKQSYSSTDVFLQFTTSSAVTATNAYIRRNKITIDGTVAHSGTRDCYIPYGEFIDNEVTSNASARVSIQNYLAGRTILIGHNKFSPYFYYKGEATALDLKIEGEICRVTSHNSGVAARIVHGGYARTSLGQWAQIGDVTYEWAQTSGNPMAYRCTVAGSPGTWEPLWNKL